MQAKIHIVIMEDVWEEPGGVIWDEHNDEPGLSAGALKGATNAGCFALTCVL